MADIQANIGINLETQQALAQLKALQKQISAFHTSMAKGGAAAQAATANMQQNLINSINATGKFNAQLTNIKTTTESFTNALEKNKLSFGQYFKYGAASTKTFSRFFRTELDTVNKVARERVKDLQTQYIKMGRDANGAMKAIAVRPLALDMGNLGTQTAIAAQKQQLFNQLLRQGSTNLLNFGKNTQWAGRQLMVGFTIPLTILGTTAGRVFMEMEKQAIAFRKVYGDLFTPTSEREKALKDIQALGEEFTKYGIAIADTIGLAADAAAAGFSGADLQAQTQQATKLAVLGQIETQQALETTIALQNAFKLSNDDLANSINFLNAVENQTVVSLDDITTAIPKVAPVIKSLGGDVEDLAFFLAAMKEGGVNASEGANALKSGLARIINPTQKATEFMASLGVNIKGIVEQNAGDLMGTMMDLGRALDELDPLNRSRAIEQLFGRFQFARISTLFDNITKEGTQAQRVADLASASIEELARLSESELGIVSESTTAKFTGAFERMKASLAPIGEEFMKIAIPFIEFGTKVLDSFNNLGDGTKKIILGLVGIIGGIGPIAVMTFGLLMNGLANAIKGFAALSGALNRSKQDTSTLGQQFEYMNQEQLQASAVAASLDQIHSKLVQTFTSEAGAVDRYRQALEKAVVVQSKFRGPIVSGGKTIKPQGYASGGIVSGPGTGTSDSIAAMISNGEAIVPAAMVEKYGPLVQGIIADNIPGYAKGNLPARAHMSAPFAQGSAQYSMGVSMAGLESLAAKFPQMIKVVSNLVAELPQKLNIALIKGVNQTDFSMVWQSLQGKMLSSAELGGLDISIQDNIDAVNRLEQEIHDEAIAIANSTKDKKVNDDILAKSTKTVIERNKEASGAIGKAARAFEAAANQIGQVRIQPSTAEVRSGLESGQFKMGDYGKVMAGDTAIARVSQSAQYSGKVRPASSYNPTASYSRQSFKAQEVEAVKAGARTGAAFARARDQKIADPYVANRDRNSPHKLAAKDGSDDGKSYSQARNKAQERYRDPATGQFARRPESSGIPASDGRPPRKTGGFGDLNRGLMTASFALTSLSSVAMFAGGETGKFAEMVTKVSAGLFALSSVIELVTLATEKEAAAKLAGGFGKVGGAFKAGAAGGAGMFGRLAGGLKGVVSIIPKFALGLTGAIGVIGLLAGGAFMLYKAYQKQKQSIEGLGNVATMSAEKMQQLGDALGVTIKESALSRGFAPALQGVSAETQAGATGLIGSEAFQETFAKDIEAIKNGAAKDVELALKTLGARLEASGFAQDQVQAIVNALLTEAGRTDVILDFASLGISSEDARAGLQSALSDARAKLQAAPTPTLAQSGNMMISNTEVSTGMGRGYQIQGTEVAGLPTPEKLQAVDQYASALAGSFEAMGMAVEGGLVPVEEFNSYMDTMIQDFASLSEQDQQQVFDKMLESLPDGSEALKELIGEVDGLDAKMALVRAKSTGLINDDAIAKYAEEMKTAQENGQSILPILTRMNNLQSEMVDLKEQETANAILQAEITAGGEEMQNRIDQAQQQVDVYNQLIAAGVPAAQAQEMIANSTVTAALAAAYGTEEFGKLIDQYNAMAEVEGQVKKITSSGGGGGGAAKQTSAIDKLTSSLRNLVSANAEVTEGFDASSRSISDVLNSGTAGFNGLEQQIRNLGGSQDLIDIIVGMSPEEFAKYKDRLFDFDPATKSIVGLKAEAKKLGSALRAIALGEYINEQRQNIVNAQNQLTAFTRLRNAGLSYADALKVVQNQSIATAIATAATAAELNEILRITNEVAKLQEKMDKVSANDQAAQSVRQSNKEYANQAAVLNKLAKEQGQYTDAQISAILDNPDLATLFLNPKIDPKTLKTALRNAANRANLELQVAISTEEGKYKQFQDYVAEVNDYFDREENKINIQFGLDTKADQGIVRDAENRIATLQYQIDDYQAQLKGIEDQEKVINDRYTERFKALDEVAKANDRINRSQQAQLDIADALSRGDIAAAARAQQQLRDQQAQAAAETRRETLQRQQAAEIAAVRSDSGMSRTQIDDQIKSLQDEIFSIEESTLEPAQERIRLAEYNRDLQIDTLEVSGKTKDMWEQIANATDIARQNTEEFELSVKRALALAEYFQTGFLDMSLFAGQEEALASMGVDVAKVKQQAAISDFANKVVTTESTTTATQTNAQRLAAEIQNLNSLLTDKSGTSVLQREDIIANLQSATKAFSDELGGITATSALDRAFYNAVTSAGGTTSIGKPVPVQLVTNQSKGSKATKKSSPVTSTSGNVITNTSSVSNAVLQSVINKEKAVLANYASTGRIGGLAMGGVVKGYAAGGFRPLGSDIVNARLTPGEFVVRRPAVKGFGVDNLEKINRGTYDGGSVYNYSLAVNVKSDANPDQIANAVMRNIKRIDSQRIRGNRL